MNDNRKPTQCERVKDYIAKFGSITQYQAFIDLGIMRLASRVSELRKSGEPIEGEFVKVKNRLGEECEVKKYFIKTNDERSA